MNDSEGNPIKPGYYLIRPSGMGPGRHPMLVVKAGGVLWWEKAAEYFVRMTEKSEPGGHVVNTTQWLRIEEGMG